LAIRLAPLSLYWYQSLPPNPKTRFLTEDKLNLIDTE
jgi:hypothetical protein